MGGAGGAREVPGVMQWQPRRQSRRLGEARLNLESTGSLPAQEVSATKLMRQGGSVAGSGNGK